MTSQAQFFRWKTWDDQPIPYGVQADAETLARISGYSVISDDALSALFRNRHMRIFWRIHSHSLFSRCCVYRNQRHWYYWTRMVVRVMRHRELLPARPRCTVCLKRFRDRWYWNSDEWFQAMERWSAYGACSAECHTRAIERAWQRRQQDRKEMAWLHEGRKQLKAVRVWIRDRTSHEVSKSRRRVFGRDTTSRT